VSTEQGRPDLPWWVELRRMFELTTSNEERAALSDDSNLSDRSLLRRLRSGEQDAATELYLKYASRLISLAKSQSSNTLASRVEAEDVVQSVFRTFFRRVVDGCYEVPQGEELWQLFLVLALNKIRNLAHFHAAQKRNVSRTVSADVLGDLATVNDDSDFASLRLLEMTIDEVISEMTESSQTMIRLRIEGHTVQAIAAQTSRSKRSVERVLQGFREKMSGLLGLAEDESTG
jgi:RNA polymerase sigma-70 factor (ECF subfamily)